MDQPQTNTWDVFQSQDLWYYFYRSSKSGTKPDSENLRIFSEPRAGNKYILRYYLTLRMCSIQIDFATLFNFYSSCIIFWNRICLCPSSIEEQGSNQCGRCLSMWNWFEVQIDQRHVLPLPINTVISTLPRIRDRRRRWWKEKYSRKWTQVSL